MDGNVVRLYDARTAQEVFTLRGPAGLRDAAFSPDGSRIAALGWHGVVQVWTAPRDPAAWQAERRAAFAPSLPVWYRVRADEAERAGDWYAAVFNLSRLIDAQPAQPGSGFHHFRRGLALAQLGRAAEADKEFERARVVKDDFPETTLANVHASLGRWDMASKLYARATEARNATAIVYYRHALLCLHQKDRAGYATACSTLMERFGKGQTPADATTAAWSCALSPGALRDLQPAVEAARRAVRDKPADPAARTTLGAILYGAGQDAKPSESCTNRSS